MREEEGVIVSGKNLSDVMLRQIKERIEANNKRIKEQENEELVTQQVGN